MIDKILVIIRWFNIIIKGNLLSFKWLKIDVETDTKIELPFFTGSMLRGVLGYALKRVVCINPSYKCKECFASNECLYYQFYEEVNLFHQYRLGLTLQPKNLNFSFYLFEEATTALPYMLSSIKKALEEEGVGNDRRPVHIVKVLVNNHSVYDGEKFTSLKEVMPNVFDSRSMGDSLKEVRLTFTMPIRLKENNRLARDTFSLHTLIGSIHNRYLQLKGEKMHSLGYRVEGEIIDSSLTFVEMKRYSNRHKKSMKIGGLKGELLIKGLDTKSYEYLKLGEIIAAGKQTVFGLGAYTLEEIK